MGRGYGSAQPLDGLGLHLMDFSALQSTPSWSDASRFRFTVDSNER